MSSYAPWIFDPQRIEDLIAEDDKVVERWTQTMTHTSGWAAIWKYDTYDDSLIAGKVAFATKGKEKKKFVSIVPTAQ